MPWPMAGEKLSSTDWAQGPNERSCPIFWSVLFMPLLVSEHLLVPREP